MNFIYNNSLFKERRRALRANPTDAEQVVWAHIRNRQIEQCRFRRQYSVGPYILDFYCPTIRLAIELDGKQHEEQESALYDSEREKYLMDLDIKTIRYQNGDVMKNTKNVIENIRTHINQISPLMVRGTKGDTA